MKKYLSLLFFVLLAPLALATNTTIEAITQTIVLPNSTDYIPVSGATRGTSKFAITGMTYLTATRTTLANLSITGAADGTGILVLGGATIGDGAGGSYYYSASSSATPNGTTIIQPSSLPATGRWLIATGNITVPGVSTLGGVFSNAGTASKWVHSINTDGTVTLTQPAAGDISGLGSMAIQGASAVAITGGTIDNTVIGGVTPANGTFTNLAGTVLTTTGNATIGNAGGSRSLTINGGNVSGQGPLISLQRNGAANGLIGTDSAINGGSSIDLDIYANAGSNVAFYANAVKQGYITTSGELNFGFGVFSKPVAQYDASGGAIYLGYGAGTALITSIADNSGTAAPISFYSGASAIAIMNATTGLVMQGSFKAQQSAAPTGGNDLTNKTYVDSVSGIGSPKIINVRSKGAVGDGVTNDTSAINTAIAALANGYTLYFPAGKYLITAGSLTNLTSLTNITICGDGRSSILYSTATNPAASPFFVLAGTCDLVTVRDFAIVGSATVRTSGNHGLCIYSAHTLISGIYITGTGDFGVYVGSGGSFYNKEVQLVNCISDHTLGDGFHFGPVTDSELIGCQSYYTGDDGLGLGDDGGIGYPPQRIEITGYQSIQAGNHAGGGTHGAGIRLFDGATDIHINGGAIYQSCEAGLTTGRFYGTTAYNTRIVVNGLKVYQCLQNIGMYANINFQFCNGLSVTGCWSEAPLSQACYAFLDCNNVSVIGNTAKDGALRSFQCDSGTTTNVATTWSNWNICNNVCIGTPTNESYYFVPATGIVISNVLISGNTENGQSTTNYITTNQLAGVCKIVNNTSLGGKAILNGGSGITPTTTNNN